MAGISDYTRLGDHLAARGAAGESCATLGLAAIEALTGRPLPLSARDARRYRAWWMRGAAYASAWDGWVRVGWHVTAVDLDAGTVTFVRTTGAPMG
jgi:hypothetical protein